MRPTLEERSQRIVDAAIELAEEGGFQAVRLRDVASLSGVALGTLYARFSCKEDILIAALEQETQKFEILLNQFPLEGDSINERAMAFFGITSRALFDRTNFAKAMLKSVASGTPGIADKIIRYQDRMNRMIVATIRGTDSEGRPFDAAISERERMVAFLLQQIWFGALISWVSESETEEGVLAHMTEATRIVIGGSSWPDQTGPFVD